MVLVLRYMFLGGLAIGSAFVLLSATASTGRFLLYADTFSGTEAGDIFFAGIVVAILLALWTLLVFMFRVFPRMLNRWFERHKTNLGTAMLGLLVCLVFVLT